MSADWRSVNLRGGFQEELVADLVDGAPEGASLGRGCVVIQTNATSSFHVTFSHSDALPTRGTDNPVLRFVVGKRRNSMTCVGIGNPYPKKEPIESTKSADALLTDSEERSRTYWFLYDRAVAVAAMGVQGTAQADLCRLVCRFKDATGFKQEAFENLRHVIVSSGKQPVSLRIVRVCAPPDVSIPRYRFDAEAWASLPWEGCSVVFELDEAHRSLVDKVQKLLMKSPLAPFYCIVAPRCVSLNAVRLLDPLRRPDLGPDSEDRAWTDCFRDVQERAAPVLASAPWTYCPMRFNRADCTSITLEPAGASVKETLKLWATAIQGATRLRNAATGPEMLTISFAFEVFPIQGESAQQMRRDLVRDITAVVEKEWGIMEFRNPQLVCWHTAYDYKPVAECLGTSG